MDGRWYKGTWEPGIDVSPEQTEFATANRVLFVTTPYPRNKYVGGIVVSDEDLLWRGQIPTEEEVTLVAEFIRARIDKWFPKPNRYREEMEQYAPYDIDTAPSVYFIKYPHGGWGYRVSTWRGMEFLPNHHDPAMTLEKVIDRANNR